MPSAGAAHLAAALAALAVCAEARPATTFSGGAAAARPPPPRALDVLYRGEVSPPHLSGGGLLAGSRGQGGWERAIAAIEAQAAALEARADEVRAAVHPETGVGLQLRLEEGVFVVGELEPAGAAALSGHIEAGDELVAVDHTPVRGLNLYEATVLLRGPPASDVVLTLARGGGTTDVALQRSAPGDREARTRLSSEDRLRLAASGELVGSAGTWGPGFVLGDALAVERVLPDSSAAAAGVRRGDVLLSVDGMRVTGGSPSKVAPLLTSRRCGVVLHLLLTRRGHGAAADAAAPVGAHRPRAETLGGEAAEEELVAVRVCCSEACKGQGGDSAGGGDGSFTSTVTSTKKTIKAVTGLFKGLFK